MKAQKQEQAPEPVTIVSTVDFNTNNSWGFGGGIGKQTEFSNGLILREGTAYYRHLPKEKFKKLSIRVDEDFAIDVRRGQDHSKVCLYKDAGDSYRATYGEVEKPFDYETEYTLIRTVVNHLKK